jgi:glycosyltransferase involved in cell wall biosynthesis
VSAELTIIGSEPPEPINGLPIQAIRFLDKRNAIDRARLNEILLSSHVMLFPARADCSPIALCEAAAYGIPVVASDVGGIGTIVTEQTGRLMPSSSTPEQYADAVVEMIGDADRYRAYIRSSRQRYEELLNWDKWAQSVLTFCEQLI